MRLIFSCRKEEFYDFSGEEIRNDNELIDNLKISPSDVVLVEMRNDSQVPWLLHLEKEIKTYKCFYCKTEIDDVIRCNFCVEVKIVLFSITTAQMNAGQKTKIICFTIRISILQAKRISL